MANISDCNYIHCFWRCKVNWSDNLWFSNFICCWYSLYIFFLLYLLKTSLLRRLQAQPLSNATLVEILLKRGWTSRTQVTWVHVQENQSKLARRGVHEQKLRCIWVETAKVFRSQACKAEKLLRQGVLGLPQSWHWEESSKVLPLFWSTSYEYLNIIGHDTSHLRLAPFYLTT